MSDFWRLTAFAHDPAGGNPAGVVLTEKALGFSEMQRIAAEVGYARTAFLVQQGPATYRARYFNPLTEIAFCGHATIAAAVALSSGLAATDQFMFITNAGPVPVDLHRGPEGTSAGFSSPATRNRPLLPPVLNEALEAFRWDISVLDPDIPPTEAYGGALHLILALRTRQHLAEMHYDFERLRELMWNRNWTTVALIWRASHDIYYARNAFPIGGVREDPATGGAAAALGGYLRDHQLLDRGARFTIRQGDDMGRPSTIEVEAPAGRRSVRVRGWAAPLPRPVSATGFPSTQVPDHGGRLIAQASLR